MRKLWIYMKPYKLAILIAPLWMMLEVSMDLLQPRFMASIVDKGVAKGNMSHIGTTGMQMVMVALIGMVAGICCTIFTTKASQGFGTDLRLSAFGKVQTLSFRQLDEFKTGSLITRITADIVQLQNLMMLALRATVRSTSLLIGSVIMAFIISPRLALIAVAMIPLLFLILYVIMSKANPYFRILQKKLDRVNTVLQENTAGIRLVKAFVRADFEQERFGKANGEYLDVGLKASRTIALNMPLLTIVLNIGIVAVLWYGGVRTWHNGLPIGDLAAFISYMTQILFSLISVGMMMMNFARAKASADRVNELLQAEPDMEEPAGEDALSVPAGRPMHSAKAQASGTAGTAGTAGAVQAIGGNGGGSSGHGSPGHARGAQIVFDCVSFSYNEDGSEPVLEEISFAAEPGETIGILGGTGAGKSSLVSLIPRLYDVTSGSVRIDGIDVRATASQLLRSRIGMVLQQTILFGGTIADNIRYGAPQASDDEVIAAAKAAQAHDFIAQMPDGYQTILGQRGVNLSGGQKQRVAIARALVMQPDILILDDSTSAIDLATEACIQQSLRRLHRDTTCLIIAQRISSVEQADKIIVLENGRMAAMGSHAELMASSPVYQDIHRSQQRKEETIHAS